MKILHVIHSVNPRGGGPIEGIRQFAPVLARLGIASEVMSLDAPDSPWTADFPVPLFPTGPARTGYGYTPRAGGYCYNAIFPDDKLAIIVLSNGSDFQGVAERITSRVLAAYVATVEDPRMTAIAKDWFHRLQSGTVDLSKVAPAFAQRLTPDFLSQIHESLAGAPDPTDWVYLGSHAVPGAVIYRYSITWAGATHTWSVGVTPEGKIAGSLLQ